MDYLKAKFLPTHNVNSYILYFLTHFKTALQYSQEEYDIEQKKFAVDYFDQIKSKLIHQEFSPNWLIWYPSSAEINLIKPSTSGDAISITSHSLLYIRPVV